MSHLKKLYNHFMETGKDLLPAYINMLRVKDKACSGQDDWMISDDEFEEYLKMYGAIKKLNIFSEEEDRQIFGEMDLANDRHLFRRIELGHRRFEALKYTSDKSVRTQVFEKYGEQCLNCGSYDDIQLDHIYPVSKGGRDTIENLQPLCKSCNCTKGVSIVHCEFEAI